MTWTRSEAEELEYYGANGGREVFLECPGCGSQVVATSEVGDVVSDADLLCECGTWREEQ